jgi:hypothetical protein
MIGAVASQLLGLFVDDGYLAAGILVVVAVASALAFAAEPLWIAGLILALALPAALAASVVVGARQAERKTRTDGRRSV